MSALKTTVPVRLYPTPQQAAIWQAHGQEYISTVNVLVLALDSDLLPEGASTQGFTAALPSAVKNQVLRDARSVWKRSCELGVIPILRKPICQWNNQNWRIAGDRLIIPVCQNGQVGQIAIRCGLASRGEPLGQPGILRIKRKRGRWIADAAYTSPEPDPAPGERVMGIDLGVKVPAVVHVIHKGQHFLGSGRCQHARRRRVYAKRQDLQHAKKICAVRQSQGKEQRWMRGTNHKLSHDIVSHAQAQGVGIIRLERLAGIRRRTVRHAAGTSSGAQRGKARTNTRLLATWTCSSPTRRHGRAWWGRGRGGAGLHQPDVSGLLPPQHGDQPPLGLRGVWLDGAPGRCGRDQHES